MLLGFVKPHDTNHVRILVNRLDQFRKLLGRMLQIVIHRNDELAPRLFQSADNSTKLTNVVKQVKPSNPRIALGQVFDFRPGHIVRAGIIHQHYLKRFAKGSERGLYPCGQFFQPWPAPVNRYDNAILHSDFIGLIA